jgi:hypothetical protein
MKRLFFICIGLLFFVFSVSPALSIQYCKDFLEPGNPGGKETSAKTWDEEVTVSVSEEIAIDIWLNDCPENMITSGFAISYDPSMVSLLKVEAYDNNDLLGSWDPGFTHLVEFAPDAFMFVLAQLGGSGVIPDDDGDIILGRVWFRCLVKGEVNINVRPIPGFDTNVSINADFYDPQMLPNDIIIHQLLTPCCTGISPDPKKVFSGETMQFTAYKSGTCDPPSYVWSDDCEHATIDPVTGIFTIAMTDVEEECSVCLTDTGNPFSCTDMECDPPADCCANFTITYDADEDGIADDEDNCLNQPNGPDLGTCIYGSNLWKTCTSNEQCGAYGFCSMNQEDNFPHDGNGIGEACESGDAFDPGGDPDGNMDGFGAAITISEECSPGYTDCGNGYCCPPETPFCGEGEDEGLCFVKGGCPVTEIFGLHSAETTFLRNVRDGILSKTLEGRELIKLYYRWSPTIVKVMREDKGFQREIKEILETFLSSMKEDID